MKVRVGIGKEMNLGFQIPDGMEYKFMLKVLRIAQSINRGEEMENNFKDFLKMREAKVFAETDETLDLDPQQATKIPDDQEESCTADSKEIPDQESYGRYIGFLHIKCSHCGEIKSFCAKKPITGYFCKNCKKLTDLDDLKPLWIKCTCGGRHKYRTNLEDKLFDMECPDCGKFIAMEYDSKRKVYNQIQEDE